MSHTPVPLATAPAIAVAVSPMRATPSVRPPSTVSVLTVLIVGLLLAGVGAVVTRTVRPSTTTIGQGPATDVSASAPPAASAAALGSGQPNAAALQKAATTTTEGTARVTFAITSGSSSTKRADGAWDFTARRARLQMDPTQFGAPGIGTIEMIFDYSHGAVMYMHLPNQLMSRAHGRPWVRLDIGAMLTQAGVDIDSLMQNQLGDPTSALSMLRGADSVTPLARERLRGVDTTHYRVVTSLDRAIAAAKTTTARQTLTKLGTLTATRTFAVDVWVDEAGHVRRVQQTIDAPTGPVTTAYEFYDFGTPVSVQLPPADQVSDFDTLTCGCR
jgi:hypothetical protein